MIVDIGGGSTEITLGGGDGVRWHTSLQLGCVRMTERFLPSDPPAREELVACGGYVRDELRRSVAVPSNGPLEVIGVAGTVTTLAALDLGLTEYDAERIHGHRISRAAVRAQLERLAALPVAERREVPGLEPDRAPVILGGVVVLAEVLDHFGLDAIEASERDILHGAALAAAELPEPEEGAAPPGAYTCC